MVCSKPQFLSDIEAFNAFHSSACVLLYRAPLKGNGLPTSKLLYVIDPAFYSLSIVILRLGDLGLHFVSEGCLLVKVTALYPFNT